MNFLDYLKQSIEAAPREKAYADIKLKRGEKTPSMILKRRNTFLAQKYKKYQAAFSSFNNRATAMNLALYIDMCRDSVNHDLKKLIAEKRVQRVGSIMGSGMGANRAYVYSWDFLAFPVEEGE